MGRHVRTILAYLPAYDWEFDLIVRNQLCVRPAVGERYTANWPAVPSRYGSRYRDTSRYWYRFDNVDRIYQIDRRTGRIVRITRV